MSDWADLFVVRSTFWVSFFSVIVKPILLTFVLLCDARLLTNGAFPSTDISYQSIAQRQRLDRPTLPCHSSFYFVLVH